MKARMCIVENKVHCNKRTMGFSHEPQIQTTMLLTYSTITGVKVQYLYYCRHHLTYVRSGQATSDNLSMLMSNNILVATNSNYPQQ